MSLPELSRRSLIGSTVLVSASAAFGAAPDPANPPVGAVYPAGAVYFRKSNPPPDDWARDYAEAAKTGMNTFRHWFIWSAIEVAPGTFDWADYDRQMDLAAANGIKVVIAIIDGMAPEWAFRKFAHARFRAGDGFVFESNHSVSSGSGGGPGLCLDNPDARAADGRFITALVSRYRHHPALLGYDIWNETSTPLAVPPRHFCFCGGTKARFRVWLKKRYGTIAALNQAWTRYSYTTWDDIDPPQDYNGYAESLDWVQFRIENAYETFDWRIALVKKLDPVHLIINHGQAVTLTNLGVNTCDEWRAAKRVDVYGCTWIASRQGSEAWKQYQAVDIVRAGARGKPFWHAEATGGPLWMQPQLLGRPREDGRTTSAEDVRLTFMVSSAAGARGYMYTRYRGLLDGPLFGAFGVFAMDGSPTPQSAMVSKLYHWANANQDLWASRPVRGDVAILFAEESEIFTVVQQKASDYYAHAARGAYQAFFDNNIQADFVKPENIDEYKLVYVPFPLSLRTETVARLVRFVSNGGTLIAEGFPAYFDERGHVGTVQPNLGLDKLFGCREAACEFAPDISNDLQLELYGQKIYGRTFRQDYALAGGKAVGHYDNGGIAAVENAYGAGRTLLIGSYPGAGYYHHHGAETRMVFARFLADAKLAQRVGCDNPKVQARLHEGAGGTQLWLTNATPAPQTAKITVDANFSAAKDLWADLAVQIDGKTLTVTVPGKDAAVFRLS